MTYEMSEKSEEPTETKLHKARNEGQVPVSHDLMMAVSLGSGLAVLLAAPSFLLDHVRALIRHAIHLVSRPDNPPLWQGMSVIFSEGAWLLIAFVIAAVAGPTLCGLLQTRFNIAFKKLSPKLDAINPVNGVKRIFSVRTLLELLKTVIKALIIGAALWIGIAHYLPLLLGSAYLPLSDIAHVGYRAFCLILGVGFLVMLVFGVADVGLQHWLHLRDQRMTKDEVKREFKENEGNPEIKQQQRQFAQEISQSPPQQRLDGAKALIVNPTHYAVAIRFDSAFGLPQVMAKGLDHDALALRAAAQSQQLPIVANPPLARALYQVELDHAIPEELFETVAAILRWVDGLGKHESLARDGAPPCD